MNFLDEMKNLQGKVHRTLSACDNGRTQTFVCRGCDKTNGAP